MRNEKYMMVTRTQPREMLMTPFGTVVDLRLLLTRMISLFLLKERYVYFLN